MTEENAPQNNTPDISHQKEKSWKTIGIVSLCITLLLLIGAVIGGWLLWKSFKKEVKVENTEKQETQQEETEQEKTQTQQNTQEELESDEQPSQERSSEEPEEEIVGIDSLWKKYINRRLGFSIDFPREFYYGNASCRYVTTEGDHSYRPFADNVETTVISSRTANAVYITHASYAELTGETVEGLKHFYSGCEIRSNSWINMENNYPGIYTTGWKIIIEDAQNNAELNEFIRSVFGSGCVITERRPSSTQPHVEDIKVSDSDSDHSDCQINYMYVIKYHTNLKKVATWNLGQACTFTTTYYTNCLDEAMTNSFRFLVP